MKFKPLACGFHSHTDMSLDGGSTVDAKIKNAANLGRIADCCTDHGVMSNIVPHWSAAQKLFKDKKIATPIRSIHGIEAYIVDPDRPYKVMKNGKTEPQYLHLTIHFKTAKAYQYFCSLTPRMESRAIIRWGERKPMLLLEELEPIAGQITLGSGCLVGPVQKNFLAGRSDLAEAMYVRLRNLAGPGNFFAEVFPHIIDKEWKKPERNAKKEIIKPGEFVPTIQRRDENAIDAPFAIDPCTGLVDIQKHPNEGVRMLAAKYGDPVIISLDDHYACAEDRVVQEARLGNGSENWKFYGSYHSPTSEYCAEQLQKQLGVSDKEIEEWIDNSYKFVDLFSGYKLETSKDRWLLPTMEMVYGVSTKTTKEKFWELVTLHGRMPAADSPQYQVYKDRVDYELSVLCDNSVADFMPYFFVMEDAARYAKANDIMWNTRGSAGGSLALFLLGVSITDPIKYDLPFERFLTLGRILSGSLPDVDSDWQDRQVILAYLASKYGDWMAMIATDLMLRLKTSILDVERSVLGFVRFETSMMCRAMKGAPQGMSDVDWLFGFKDKTTGDHVKGFWDEDTPASAELRTWAKENAEMWATVQKCIGICKTRGIHAGGIVLTPGPVQNYVPLIHSKQGLATAYSMKPVEVVGCVKYDFLGVSTLKAQGISIKSINRTFPALNLQWGEFAHEPRVYSEIIARDLLTGIFQMSGGAVRSVAKQINPKNIRDIALWISLMRPGAMDAPSPDPADVGVTAAEYYIKCAQGHRKPYFIHPDLEDILGDTYGVIVTQEQGLKLFRVLADYTYETAEVVRRAIGKKEAALLTIHSGVLKEKCLARGWTEAQAQKLYDSIEASARYSFNMSHAVAYAIVGYNGCWMKLLYPVHYWLGELTVHSDDHDKLREYLIECRHLVLDIDIVKSHPTDWVIEDDKLRPPLSLMKGCGSVYTKNLKLFMADELGAMVDAPEETEAEAEVTEDAMG